MKKNILFVHQSADLYGSDRVLLALVSKLDRAKFHPIVLLPVDGPLIGELVAAGIECYVIPITRLARSTLSVKGLLTLPANLITSIQAFSRAVKDRHIHVVHSNTLAVLSGAIWAWWHRVPHVWHVHEIVVSPIFVRKAFALLLSWFADCVVCVSDATKQNLMLDKPALNRKICVVWNGLSRESEIDADAAKQLRHEIGARDEDIVVALVGRINRWKGQQLLVSAADILWYEGVRNIQFVFVGSVVPGQESFLSDLKQRIEQSEAKKCLKILPFTSNVWPIWDACDIAVVPSTEPEPFGMVALEAMASSRPVIAANHGGLSEIVVPEETGFLVTPGSATELAEAIKKLAVDARLRAKMGQKGFLRYQSEFTLNRYAERMVGVYENFS